jgi:Zn-dependent protease with chaperone function
MKPIRAAVFVVALVIPLTLSTPVAARGPSQDEPPGRDPAVEQEIYDRLEAVAPEAVPIFQDATRAMDGGDLAAAKRDFERVLELAPGFPDAARRLSYVELDLRNVAAAVEYARLAYTADDSPQNRIALAWALLSTGDWADANEALTHAMAAVEALPDDLEANMTLLYAGIVNESRAAMRRASTKLVEIDPQNPVGHYYFGLFLAADEEWERAEQELLLAQELGMPAEYVQAALNEGIASQARWARTLRAGGYTLLAWLTGLPLLFASGALLSGLTLAATRRYQSAGEFRVGRAERVVQAIYRVVIAATSLYFYASIPILILIVLAATGGVIYLFFVVGMVPVRIAAFIVVIALFTLFALVRSVFTRPKEREPGRSLDRDDAPALWELVEEVAGRVGTRPADAIYVTPATEIGVTERGKLLQKLRGAGERCLILGLGALSGITQGQLKSILAHEYGHFSQRDTAGGNLARQVQLSIQQIVYSLATTGQARWYNPAWLFVNGFYRVFLRVTLGAARLQEILADRYAAAAYGGRQLVEGLDHLIRQSLLFDLQVKREIEVALKASRGLSNLYVLPPLQTDVLREQLSTKVDEVMNRPTAPYDRHPAVRERIALLERLEAAEEVEASAELAWDLLPNAEGLQREMTAVVQDNVNKRVRVIRMPKSQQPAGGPRQSS